MQKTKTKIPFAVLFSVGAVLFSNQAGPLGQTKTADTLLKTWKGA